MTEQLGDRGYFSDEYPEAVTERSVYEYNTRGFEPGYLDR